MPRLLLLLTLLFTSMLVAGDDDVFTREFNELKQAGITAMKEAERNQREILNAARAFVKAAALCEKHGKTELQVEMNSFLYWCKKKMTLPDIEEFERTGDIMVAARLEIVTSQKVEPTEAKTWFDRAEEFAKANPKEDFLIAVRFFEVADRFKGTETSLKAQERSLAAMQAALKAAANPLTPVDPKPVGTKEPPKQPEPEDFTKKSQDDIKAEAEETVGKPYAEYIKKLEATAVKLNAANDKLIESCKIVVKDQVTGKNVTARDEVKYAAGYRKLLDEQRKEVDPLWKKAETAKEAFIGKWRKLFRENPLLKNQFYWANDLTGDFPKKH